MNPMAMKQNRLGTNLPRISIHLKNHQTDHPYLSLTMSFQVTLAKRHRRQHPETLMRSRRLRM